MGPPTLIPDLSLTRELGAIIMIICIIYVSIFKLTDLRRMIRQSDLQERGCAQRPTSYSRRFREIHGTVDHSISRSALGITGD